MNEHVGVDEEGLYIDVPLLNPQCEIGSKQRQDDGESLSGDEFLSDEETKIDEDDIIKDREPEQMPDVDYDKKDPPMTVGTVYSNMDTFNIALASHTIKHEFNYDIEKS